MSLRPLLRKELLTLLREPGVIVMLILPLIIYPAMGSTISSVVKSQVESATRLKGFSVAVVPASEREEGIARLLVDAARRQGLNVTLSREDPLKLLEHGYDLVIFIPCGFTYNITHGRNATLFVYAAGNPARIMSVLTASTAAPRVLTSLAGLGAPRVRLSFRSFVYLHGRLYTTEDISRIVFYSQLVIEGGLLLVFIAASQSAVAMGYEREERTLEILLSLPVPRRSIAIAKIVSSIVVALLASASILAGLYIMFVETGTPIPHGARTPYTPVDMLLVAAAMGVTAFLAASLGQLLALFTQSARGAQSATIIITLPALFMLVAGMFGATLSPSFAAVPYSAIVYAAFSPLLDKTLVAEAIAIQALEAAASVILLARLLDTELAVTGPTLLRRLVRRR